MQYGTTGKREASKHFDRTGVATSLSIPKEQEVSEGASAPSQAWSRSRPKPQSTKGATWTHGGGNLKISTVSL